MKQRELNIENLKSTFKSRSLFRNKWIIHGLPGSRFTFKVVNIYHGILTIFEGISKDYQIAAIDDESSVNVVSKYFICSINFESMKNITNIKVSFLNLGYNSTVIDDFENKTIIIKQTRNTIKQQLFEFNVRHGSFGELSFDVKQFNGLADQNCYHGGITYQYSFPEMRRAKIRQFLPLKSEKACTSEHSHLFLGVAKKIVLPYGRSSLIIYSYGKYFDIDITIKIKPSVCVGMIDPCTFCTSAMEQNFFTGYTDSCVILCNLPNNEYIYPSILPSTCVIIQSAVWTNRISSCKIFTGSKRSGGFINIDLMYLHSITNNSKNECAEKNDNELSIIYSNTTSVEIRKHGISRMNYFTNVVHFIFSIKIHCSFDLPIFILVLNIINQHNDCPELSENTSGKIVNIDSCCCVFNIITPKIYHYMVYYRETLIPYNENELITKGLSFKLINAELCDVTDSIYMLTSSFAQRQYRSNIRHMEAVIVTEVKMNDKNSTLRVSGNLAKIIVEKHSSCKVQIVYSSHDYYYIPAVKSRTNDILAYDIQVRVIFMYSRLFSQTIISYLYKYITMQISIKLILP